MQEQAKFISARKWLIKATKYYVYAQEVEGDAIKIFKLKCVGDAKIEQFEYSELYVAVFNEIYFSGLSICIGTSNSLLSNIYIVKLFLQQVIPNNLSYFMSCQIPNIMKTMLMQLLQF